MPRVSVIMPTRNQIDYIRYAVDSVLAQSFTDFEVILINNGSTDGTAEYLDSLTDPRIQVYHQEDRGAINSINRGIELSKGEFVTWVSTDNICARYFLEGFLNCFEKNQDIDYFYSSYFTIDENNKTTNLVSNPKLRYADLVFNRNAGNASFLYKKKIHDEIGMYDNTFRYSGDTDMWARIFRKYKIGYMIEPTQYYRLHSQQETESAHRDNGFIQEGLLMASRYWCEEMGSNVHKIVDDIFPNMPKHLIKDHLFYCLWALAANFRYYNNNDAAEKIYQNCIRVMPPQYTADVLYGLMSTINPDTIEEKFSRIIIDIGSNKNIDEKIAVNIFESLAEARKAHKLPAMPINISRYDFIEVAERKLPRQCSFLHAM